LAEASDHSSWNRTPYDQNRAAGQRNQDGHSGSAPVTDNANIDKAVHPLPDACTAGDLQQIGRAMAFIDQVCHDLEQRQPGDTFSQKTENTLPADNDGRADLAAKPKKVSVIGRFQVERIIGEGGFARVWLAHDPVLHRRVAIKAPRATCTLAPDAIARFSREAKAAAVLSHPNIVPVFEAGVHEGEHFIVSAYCPGVTLATWFAEQQRKIDPRLAAQIVMTLANAMEHAHQRGVIHRDLKPANIMVESIPDRSQIDADGQGTPVLQAGKTFPDSLRIADFGLARIGNSDDLRQTTEGAVVGTPAYMSPEQAAGVSQITSSSDVYSLGVIFYELLTGRLPIVGKSHIDTLLAINRDEPRPPQRDDVAVSRDLQSICLKCLRKSPTGRYPSARELADDLQRWLEGRVVRARPVTKLERAWKWCRRYPLICLAMAGMVAGLGIALWQWRMADLNFQFANQQTQRAEENVALSRQTIGEIVKLASDSRRIPARVRHELLQRAVTLQRALLASAPGNQEILEETIASYLNLARALGEMRQFEAAIEACDEGLAVLTSSELADELTNLFDTLRLNKAVHLKDAGRVVEALAILNPQNDDMTVSYRIAYIEKLSETLLEEGRLEDAWLQYQQALIWNDSRPKQNIFSVSQKEMLLQHLGFAELGMTRFEAAAESFAQALKIQSEIMPQLPYHETMTEELCLTLKGLATAEFELDRLNDASGHVRTCIENYEFLVERNPLAIRYQVQLFDTRLLQARIGVKTGDPASVAGQLSTLHLDFGKFDDQVKERGDLGIALLDVSVTCLQSHDSFSADELLERAKTLAAKLQQRMPGSVALADLQDRLNEIEALLEGQNGDGNQK
jgi:tetratricopeptide (TPR) repeat protein